MLVWHADGIRGFVRCRQVPIVPCALSAGQGRFCAAWRHGGHESLEENEHFNLSPVVEGFGTIWVAFSLLGASQRFQSSIARLYF